MPLDYQLLEVPLGALDTHDDPSSEELGTLTVAENLSSQIGGAYVKRFGYNSLANTLTDLRQLATFDTPGPQPMASSQELLAVDGAKLKSYLTVGPFWLERSGPTAPCIASESPVNFNQSVSSLLQPLSCYLSANDSIFHVWQQTAASTTALYSQLEDATTGAVTYAPHLLVAISSAVNRLVTNGTDAVLITLDIVAQTITARTYVAGSGFGLSAVLFSGAAVSPALGLIDAVFDGSVIVISYMTAVPQIAVARVNFSTLAVLHNVIQVAETPRSLAVHCVAGEFGAVVYGRTAATTTVARTFNAATAAVVAGPFTLDAANSANIVDTVRQSSTQLLCFWNTNGGTTVLTMATLTSAGAVGTAFIMPGATMGCRPWTYGGSYYIAAVVYRGVANAGNVSSVTLRCDTAASSFNNAFQPVAMHAYKTFARSNDRPMAIATGIYRWDAVVEYDVTGEDTDMAISGFRVDFTDSSVGKSADGGQGPMFAGGALLRYDGSTLCESNYLQYPEITSAISNPIGAGGLNNGTYSYIATYESVDIYGNVERSETSEPVSVTGAAGAGLNRFNVSVSMLVFTRLGIKTGQRGGKVVLWRNTQANPTVYQRLIRNSFLTMTGGTSDDIDSAFSAGSIFVDYTPDADVAANQLLYTDSGALDREPPMPSKALTVHRNRVWGISSLDPRMVFYSGELTPGEAPWFSSAQRFRIDVGGSCTALASLDDKLVVFKQDRIFYLSGDPPNQTGQGGSLSSPTLVTADCGCIEPLSVVSTPKGVMFLSQKGIHTLTRSLETEYHGEIDGILDTYPNCNAATLVQHSREARFELSNASNLGVAAVYNYRDNRWTTHASFAYGFGYEKTAVNFGGVYVYGHSSNIVAKESLSTYLDNGSFVPMQLVTAWIRPAGKQGFVRCKEVGFLGVNNSAHNLYLQVGKDYTESFPMVASWTAAQLAALPLEQVYFHLPQQKGEAFHLWLYDLYTTGTLGNGQGLTIRGFQLRVAAKRGSFEKGSPAGARG